MKQVIAIFLSIIILSSCDSKKTESSAFTKNDTAFDREIRGEWFNGDNFQVMYTKVIERITPYRDTVELENGDQVIRKKYDTLYMVPFPAPVADLKKDSTGKTPLKDSSGKLVMAPFFFPLSKHLDRRNKMKLYRRYNFGVILNAMVAFMNAFIVLAILMYLAGLWLFIALIHSLIKLLSS